MLANWEWRRQGGDTDKQTTVHQHGGAKRQVTNMLRERPMTCLLEKTEGISAAP
jgi:hypothetical protein